jgi:DNA invertase Pin-like site-specific DNA recombinase
MATAAIYARYSSDKQREASLEDQERTCRRRAEQEGWTVLQVYGDAAVSGSRMDRPGYAAMLADAASGAWTVLLVEDLSRMSRDEVEGVQGVRRLEHRGIRVVGVSDGYDSDRPGRTAQRSVRALLSALYLEDLAARTRRGLEGQVSRGFRAGGMPYGYRPVREDGGSRLEIDPDQAAVVVEIWEKFAAGQSPRRIAADLNARGVQPPRQSNRKGPASWISSALYGHPAKGTGILRNPIYLGRAIWNRSRWEKDPDTGARVRRERPETEWIVTDAPDLRIVPFELEARVAARHAAIEAATGRARDIMGNAGRTGPGPRHLFSGLLVCANCGAPWVTVNRDRYGCSAARYRGPAVCDVRSTVARQRIEERLLDVIRQDIYSPANLAIYRKAFTAELRRLASQSRPDVDALKRRQADLSGEITNMVSAIATGTHSPALLAALERAEADLARVNREIAQADTSALVLTLPGDLDALFQGQLADLESELARDLDAAREILRDMLGPIRIARHDGALVAELSGIYQGAKYASFGSGGRISLSACLVVPL